MSPLRDRDPIESQLRPWLAEEGMVREPDDLFERVASGTREVRQRPGWLVRMLRNGMVGAGAGPAARWREHKMATALGLGTIVIALAVGIGSIGSGLLPGLGVVPGAVSDAPSPSASPDVAQTEQEPGPEAFFTGALLSQGTDVKLMEMSEGDGVEHVRGVRFIERHEWSDPRLPMDSQAILNWDVYEAGVAVSNAVLFEGPDGYWMGTATTFCDHEDNCRGMTLLTGHEAYEGLTALIAGGSEAGGPGSLPTWDSEGFIFEGEMPPFPEPLEPAAK